MTWDMKNVIVGLSVGKQEGAAHADDEGVLTADTIGENAHSDACDAVDDIVNSKEESSGF
jgi:hypothetical protein